MSHKNPNFHDPKFEDQQKRFFPIVRRLIGPESVLDRTFEGETVTATGIIDLPHPTHPSTTTHSGMTFEPVRIETTYSMAEDRKELTISQLEETDRVRTSSTFAQVGNEAITLTLKSDSEEPMQAGYTSDYLEQQWNALEAGINTAPIRQPEDPDRF